MPVWQSFYDSHKSADFELLAVAVDIQGAASVKPYAKEVSFPTLLDSDNALGRVFGFKAIPNGIFVDETGIVQYTKFGAFDIRKPAYRRRVEQFLVQSDLEELADSAEGRAYLADTEVSALFESGMSAYRAGDIESALIEWRKCIALQPDNWIIRKQVWAIENPERFYAGDIDSSWQAIQIDLNR